MTVQAAWAEALLELAASPASEVVRRAGPDPKRIELHTSATALTEQVVTKMQEKLQDPSFGHGRQGLVRWDTLRSKALRDSAWVNVSREGPIEGGWQCWELRAPAVQVDVVTLPYDNTTAALAELQQLLLPLHPSHRDTYLGPIMELVRRLKAELCAGQQPDLVCQDSITDSVTTVVHAVEHSPPPGAPNECMRSPPGDSPKAPATEGSNLEGAFRAVATGGKASVLGASSILHRALDLMTVEQL